MVVVVVGWFFHNCHFDDDASLSLLLLLLLLLLVATGRGYRARYYSNDLYIFAHGHHVWGRDKEETRGIFRSVVRYPHSHQLRTLSSVMVLLLLLAVVVTVPNPPYPHFKFLSSNPRTISCNTESTLYAPPTPTYIFNVSTIPNVRIYQINIPRWLVYVY